MTDLTKITTPYGILCQEQPEVAEALRAHGGPYEWYSSEGGVAVWVDDPEPDDTFDLCPHITIRVKPQPPKPREWWAVGKHLHDTKQDAESFLSKLRDQNLGMFLDWQIIHVREVLE